MTRLRAATLVAAALGCGCAPKLPLTYRLAPQATAAILVPPNVAGPDVARRTFKSDIVSGKKPCAGAEGSVEVQRSGGRLRITVSRDALAARPPGWLNQWAATAESTGCVAPGEGANLASRILESVPLDPAVAYRLLHEGNVRAGFVDLGPGERLEVRSPVTADGTTPAGPAVESSRTSGLEVEARINSSIIGFETALYALEPKPNRIGYRFRPLSAVRRVRGQEETAAAPLRNYVEFPEEAGFYRLYYKRWASGADQDVQQSIVVFAGETRAELESLTRALEADPNTCDSGTKPMCKVIPRSIGVNQAIVVTINSREVVLPVGATVASAIRSTGERNAERVLPELAVRKAYAGKLTEVEFDRSKQDILRLSLNGGEELSWTR